MKVRSNEQEIAGSGPETTHSGRIGRRKQPMMQWLPCSLRVPTHNFGGRKQRFLRIFRVFSCAIVIGITQLS
ncbi:MAG: hypothetical protein KDC10_00535 [Calditrichaeota bacterium]|nr:hypothetical protein [Candidatus Cloacimonadota bacterium]MCB1045656.1 hypothetical protein [Calditrichota bacterium]MCB9474638.1 hypothetical protein [Candidatus Delongbacteria bacterium]